MTRLARYEYPRLGSRVEEEADPDIVRLAQHEELWDGMEPEVFGSVGELFLPDRADVEVFM